MYFGKNLRFLRRRREMSQQQLADILGYTSDVTIQHWETGRSTPKVGVLQKICLLFGVDMETLCYSDIEKAEGLPEQVDYTKLAGEYRLLIEAIQGVNERNREILYKTVMELAKTLKESEERDAESGKAKIGKIPNQGSEDIERTQD